MWVALLWFAAPVRAGEQDDEAHVKVVMRMIGHELLLRSGDSVSRVLPVERVDGRYRLRFASAWGFDPGELVALVDSVVRRNGISGRYRVEVEACAGREVVYSYEVTDTDHAENAPCTHRVQPEGYYEVLFTILQHDLQSENAAFLPAQIQGSSSGQGPGAGEARREKRIGYTAVILPIAAVLGLAGIFVYSRRKKAKPSAHFNLEDPDSDINLNAHSGPDTPSGSPSSSFSALSSLSPDPYILSVGAFRFDKRNMTLSLGNEVIELTGKESDLLLLLHGSVNTTISRDLILNTVWGDEGDYIGRTLDVFISRLRKRLEADPGLKIINIRGVGYKLIIND